MKFAAWRKVLSIFLLAVFLCAVPSLLTACSRTPGSDSTELDYATSRYFQALYRIVNKTFHPAVLEEFHQIADALASCVAAHEDYFTAYPDAKAAYGLMVQIPDILEQNLEPNADGNYVLRELPEDHPTVHYVYVLDEYDEFEGVLSLRTLVLTDDAKPVGDVMYEDVISVPPDETEEDVAADIFKYELPAMPVVDEHNMLLGIVTVDDAWDAIEEDVSGDKTKATALKVVGIVLASLLFLGLYTLVLLQVIGYTGR